MILTKQEIQMRLGTDIKIDPFDEKQLNPNSYNLRLGDQILTYNRVEAHRYDMSLIVPLDPRSNNSYTVNKIPESGVVLQPGELYLAQTMEHTVTKNLVPVISGRSSIGRLGINVHATAGFGDIGFTGYWTLELFVVRPVIVYAGMQIAQIYYHTIQGQVEEYKGKYMKNEGVQPSMIWKEFQ